MLPLYADMASPDLAAANHAWLLPAMRKHLRGGSLAFFGETLLPLADRLQAPPPHLPPYASTYCSLQARCPAACRWGAPCVRG